MVKTSCLLRFQGAHTLGAKSCIPYYDTSYSAFASEFLLYLVKSVVKGRRACIHAAYRYPIAPLCFKKYFSENISKVYAPHIRFWNLARPCTPLIFLKNFYRSSYDSLRYMVRLKSLERSAHDLAHTPMDQAQRHQSCIF